ncbi:hypothetical protein LY78DRAFT_659860 [Colletotrichum sublineola]|nr:hypothetical protein LY78DRAFT_659860 [Colletotrichum sublineola]
MTQQGSRLSAFLAFSLFLSRSRSPRGNAIHWRVPIRVYPCQTGVTGQAMCTHSPGESSVPIQLAVTHTGFSRVHPPPSWGKNTTSCLTSAAFPPLRVSGGMRA